MEYYQQALKIQIDIGNVRLEGFNLGHLGEVYVEQEEWHLAKEHLQRCIEICDEINSPAAGAFRDSLAFVFAKEGDFEEAYRILEIGEPVVKKLPSEHAKFLCIKGRIQALDGRWNDAKTSLLEARKMADKLNVTKESEVYKNILRLERVLGIDGSYQE